MTGTAGGAAGARVVVDWTACRGRGTCSELLPERITLDEWGYPVVSAEPVAGDDRYARKAVAMCPARALTLVALSPTAPAPTAPTPIAPTPRRGTP